MPQMGGLLGGGLDAGSGTAPTGFNPGEQPDAEQTPNASPEEQQQYDAFVKNAMHIMYTEDGKAEPQVLARLSTGNKPIDTLAQTTVWIVMMVEKDAEQNQQKIEDDVIFHAGNEIMEQLADLAEAAGIHDFKQAELQGAWYKALDMYREANTGDGGRINPDEAKATFAELNQADEEGRADEVVPGFGQQTEAAMAAAQADQNDQPEEGGEEGETKTLNRKYLPNG